MDRSGLTTLNNSISSNTRRLIEVTGKQGELEDQNKVLQEKLAELEKKLDEITLTIDQIING